MIFLHPENGYSEGNTMPNPTYDIFFSGEIIEGFHPESVQNNLEKLLKVDAEKISRLFSGKPIRIKSGVDQETAIKYRTTFQEAGALIEIKMTQVNTPTPHVEEKMDTPGKETMSLLPPKTGSLIDCAPRIEPAKIPDISDITLAPPGSMIDQTEPPPELDINTEELSLAPADFVKERD